MNLGFWEVAAIAVLALLIFGPERLPEMARNVGKMVATLKREASGTLDELKRAADLEGLGSVTKDLKATGASLRKDLDLSAAIKDATKVAPTVRAVGAGPTPYDPDAT